MIAWGSALAITRVGMGLPGETAGILTVSLPQDHRMLLHQDHCQRHHFSGVVFSPPSTSSPIMLRNMQVVVVVCHGQVRRQVS